MKNSILSLLAITLSLLSIAQTGINYQAVVRDSNGDIMQNESVTIEFTILSGSTSGVTEYVESHTATTNNFGNVVAIIGQGTPSLGVFDDIEWQSTNHFLNVNLNGTDMGTTQFLNVPYAKHATSSTMINEEDVKINVDGNKSILLGQQSNADALTIERNSLNSAELVDLIIDTVDAFHDFINLSAGEGSDSLAQFIEGSFDGDVTFAVDINGRIETAGKFTRIKSGNNVDMLPIAYGYVNSAGNVIAATNNVISVSPISTGRYQIEIDNEFVTSSEFVIIGNAIDYSVCNVSFSIGGGKIDVYIRNVSNSPSTLANANFSFLVYKL